MATANPPNGGKSAEFRRHTREYRGKVAFRLAASGKTSAHRTGRRVTHLEPSLRRCLAALVLHHQIDLVTGESLQSDTFHDLSRSTSTAIVKHSGFVFRKRLF